MNNLSPQLIQEILKSRAIRTRLASESIEHFLALYFHHYIQYQTAPFQHEMLRVISDPNEKFITVVAFRESGKSTMVTLLLPIWAVIGTLQCKFILILSQTQNQARYHMMNLRRELESNELLRSDFGAFEEDTDQWGVQSIVIPKYGARITVASSEQSIRGIRSRQHRPDLIIGDDVEDLASVKTKEGRNRTYDWFTGDVIPAGRPGSTKIVVVGNLLHEDSLIMRFKESILSGKFNGKFYEYPLLNEKNEIAWPGKFKDMQAIETLKRSNPSESAWEREYLLHIVTDEEQVIFPEWIHYYDKIPSRGASDYRYTAFGVDLAISKKDTSDYTAVVVADVFGRRDNLRVYIHPNPVNERLNFPEQRARIKMMHEMIKPRYIFVENVGYQDALAQDLRRDFIQAESVPIFGQDKRMRLALTTHLLQQSQILFPRQGTEKLIDQLVGFGKEKHDDLADAFSILMNKVGEKNHRGPRVFKDKPDGF